VSGLGDIGSCGEFAVTNVLAVIATARLLQQAVDVSAHVRSYCRRTADLPPEPGIGDQGPPRTGELVLQALAEAQPSRASGQPDD
jgi:hypothetical protein